MTTFRCKRSGNLVSFLLENDIESMRKHEGYEEVKDVETTETVKTEPSKATTRKEVMKLKKSHMPSFLQE